LTEDCARDWDKNLALGRGIVSGVEKKLSRSRKEEAQAEVGRQMLLKEFRKLRGKWRETSRVRGD